MSVVEKDVKDSVHDLLVVIDDIVTSMNEEGSDEVIVIQKAVKSIERDIRDLLRYTQAIEFVLRNDH